jgi:hypothetical protein
VKGLGGIRLMPSSEEDLFLYSRIRGLHLLLKGGLGNDRRHLTGVIMDDI